jgi:hypothetical protein
VREERKLQLFSEFSSTLSKFSATGTASVMPNLADILLRNAERKQRVDDHFKSITELWEQAFEIFMTEISHVMNAQLETTLTQIRQVGDSVCSPIETDSAGTLKRQRPQDSRSPDSVEDHGGRNGSQEDFLEKEKERSSRNDRGTQPEHKRRRYDASSPSLTETRQKVPQYSTEEFQPSTQEILSQMKLKIDEQAQSLQKLTKENHEVKS